MKEENESENEEISSYHQRHILQHGVWRDISVINGGIVEKSSSMAWKIMAAAAYQTWRHRSIIAYHQQSRGIAHKRRRINENGGEGGNNRRMKIIEKWHRENGIVAAKISKNNGESVWKYRNNEKKRKSEKWKKNSMAKIMKIIEAKAAKSIEISNNIEEAKKKKKY